MKKHPIYVRTICAVAIILFLILPIQENHNDHVFADGKRFNDNHTFSQARVTTLNKQDYPKRNVNTANRKEVKLTHADVVAITEKFLQLLVQETDENYKVINHDSKASLLKEFRSVCEISVAKKYVDYYFEERNESLYIVPTETPPWFEKNQDYEMIDKGHVYEITQTNESALYGSYKIEFEFTYDKKWKITNITHLT
ncbi:hypothetical protein [Aquibacillus albus]|uniref:DUF3993 domain-containing protein n=1 Tax=Aquibacillus albus TaxID=1168171 RepID=A0ABS2MYF4_9BACI|nr:hypothetical protein [Aquibacillus albus]MBM7570902.1 hypothetical protein [Aquibacillus albus]